MDSRERTLRSALVGAFASFGFMTGFLVSMLFPVPLLWFYPLERRFAFEVHPTGLAIDFLGRLLLSAACGLAFAIGPALGFEKLKPASRRRALVLAMAWAVSFFLFAAGLSIARLISRVPVPVQAPGTSPQALKSEARDPGARDITAASRSTRSAGSSRA